MGMPTTPTTTLGFLAAGILLLLYGVQLVTDTLQLATNARVRDMLVKVARHPPVALVLGFLTTAVTQSSSATSALLVGLASSELVTLTTAFFMLLGANVGTTLVVQLLALHITNYALEILGVGALVALLTRHSSSKRAGQAVFAFGVILVGLAALEAGSQPIAASPLTADVLKTLVGAPLVLLLIGVLLAVVFSSSAASIGLVIVLAANGALPLVAALALMLGANIGTTFTALLTALNGRSPIGRRLAFLHAGTKLAGGLAALALLNPLALLLSRLGTNAGTQVGLAHMGFNVALALVFAPLARPLVQLVTRLVPDQPANEPGGPRYLDPGALASPSLALGQAMRETVRMTDLITDMLAKSMHAFEEEQSAVPRCIDELDDQLDQLVEAVKRYLTRLDEDAMTEEQARREIALLYIITDLEALGDIFDKQFMRLARRMHRGHIMFSDEGWEDLTAYYNDVQSTLQQVLAAFAAQDRALAEQCLQRAPELAEMKRTMQLRHLHRLHQGISPSLASSAIHLDLLNAIHLVLSHTLNIAHALTA